MSKTVYWISLAVLSSYFWFSSQQTKRDMAEESYCIKQAQNADEIQVCFDLIDANKRKNSAQ